MDEGTAYGLAPATHDRELTEVGAGTPRPILDRLQKEIAAVTHMPDVLQKMVEQGQTPLGNTPEEFAAAFARDAPRWVEYIRASGAKPE